MIDAGASTPDAGFIHDEGAVTKLVTIQRRRM
jgi:hypothetical protein